MADIGVGPGRRPTGGRRGVLLDRDGTIIADTGYIGSPHEVEFLDGAIAAIARLNAAGIPVAVVTNQAGVARGHFGIDDVLRVHAHIDAELHKAGAHIDRWFFCPYHPDGSVDAFARTSEDRKPAPGLGLAASAALGLDLSRSWVVGDSAVDVGLARATGARPILVAGSRVDSRVTCVPDLRTAVQIILDEIESPEPVDAPHRFPASKYDSAEVFATHYGTELHRALETIDLGSIERAVKLLDEAYTRDAAVFACGNGGSASVSNHLQCDHGKGVRNGTDLRTRVFSLSTNVELLTAIGNDLGYDATFEYQLESQARPGDVLVAVSSSGRSPNIVRALRWADGHGMQTIALTGFSGGEAREVASVSIHVDSSNYGVVEDAHQACMHLLAQFVRQSRMSSEAVCAAVF